MQIREIMTGNPVSCQPETGIVDAARLMAKRDVGAIPVLGGDGGKPIGIVTDRDVTVRIVAEGTDPRNARVHEAMTEGVVTVSPETELDEASRRMAERQVRRLVVVGSDGTVQGVVAQADLALHDRPEEVGDVLKEISQPH